MFGIWRNIEFANSYILFLLLIVPVLIAWYIFRNKRKNAEIQVSTTSSFAGIPRTFRQIFYHSLFALRMIVIALLILALARPQSSLSKKNVSIKGIDIVMAIDVSGSMRAEDFRPNRLEAAKDVATDFINGRPNDRIGLVVFSGESFTQCPLTTDHAVLKNLFDEIKIGMIEDGTAIGDGLANAVNRLKDSKAISKVVILLTDGVNNSGALDPETSAEIAQVFGIRVYTIGVGSLGRAPYPFQTPFGIQYQNVDVKIDEPLLQKIAESTDGKYFRATNKKKLEDIYKEIDQLEKSKIDVTEFHKKKEEYFPLALIAAIVFMLEIILRYTIFRSLP